jgi:hypothetical protein
MQIPNDRSSSQVQQLHTLSGWWFGTFFIFPYIGNVIIPTDEVHHFSEGLAQPPTSYVIQPRVYSSKSILNGLLANNPGTPMVSSLYLISLPLNQLNKP